MFRYLKAIPLSLALAAAPAGFADTETRTYGSDTFVAGTTVSTALDADRDAFLAGRAVTAKGRAGGDVHVAGFDVDVEADSAADLYVAGATVSVRGTVGEDLTAAAFTLRTAPTAVTQGNARIMGGSVTIDGAVKGDLTVAANEVILNAAIGGEAMIAAQTITFGPNAVVSGSLSYASPTELPIPERVIAPGKVSYEKLSSSDHVAGMRDTWDEMENPLLPTFMSMFAAFLVTLAFFVSIGAIFLAFLPKPVEAMRKAVAARPGQIFLIGIVGLSILFGLVPISALTIVGIPLVPVVLLAIVVVWTLGYMLGAFAVAQRLLDAFWHDEAPGNALRLAAFAAVICAIALLNFIPFVGWIANYTLVLLGIGAMTNAVFDRMIGNPGLATNVDMQPIEETGK